MACMKVDDAIETWEANVKNVLTIRVDLKSVQIDRLLAAAK